MNVKKYVAALSVAAVVSMTPLATTPVWAEDAKQAPCTPSEATTAVVVTPAVPGTPGTPAVAGTEGTPAIPAVDGTAAIPAVPPVTQTIAAVDEIWEVWSPNNTQGPQDYTPVWPEDERGTWQEAAEDIPPGHEGPDGVYQQGSENGNSNYFYRRNGVPEQIIVISEGVPAVPAVPGTPAVPAVPGTPGTPAVLGTAEIPASTQTVVVPAVECDTPDTSTNEVLGVEAAAGTNNGNNNNGNNNAGGGVEVQGQQATAPAQAPAQAPAPTVAAQQQAVPTSVNAGMSGETASNQLLLPAGLAMLGALLGMVAFAARRRA
ncbi:hypothetical protein [Nocardioides sp.]|uniref:hypothetical protein n=1 Tax=Nocardioides sp. TaxID=35761 RepID=UPI002C052CD4|nr:hypothetical protein [Nocardioides sp.]HXH78638.1 hypothetical protein [Nocardioides sp.]